MVLHLNSFGSKALTDTNLQWNFFENDSDVVRYEEIDYLLKSRKNQSPDLKALTAVIYARKKITNME